MVEEYLKVTLGEWKAYSLYRESEPNFYTLKLPLCSLNVVKQADGTWSANLISGANYYWRSDCTYPDAETAKLKAQHQAVAVAKQQIEELSNMISQH